MRMDKHILGLPVVVKDMEQPTDPPVFGDWTHAPWCTDRTAEKLTAEERSEIARKGAAARWSRE